MNWPWAWQGPWNSLSRACQLQSITQSLSTKAFRLDYNDLSITPSDIHLNCFKSPRTLHQTILNLGLAQLWVSRTCESDIANSKWYWSWYSNNFRYPKRNIHILHYPTYQFTPLIYGNRMDTQSNVYEQLEQYSWSEDLEFQTGLSSILASNQSHEQTAELMLRAKCFYFSRYDWPHNKTFESNLDVENRASQ